MTDAPHFSAPVQIAAEALEAFMAGLFAASGVYATLAIAATWRRYGPAVLALRGELAACGDDLREMSFRISGYETLRPSAEVYRPDFTREARRPARSDGWRAAA